MEIVSVLVIFGGFAWFLFGKVDEDSKCYRAGYRWGEKGKRFAQGKPQLVETRNEKDKRNKG